MKLNEILPTSSLFELYTTEKMDMDDPLDPFPTFSIWKTEYLLERKKEMDDTCVDDIPKSSTKEQVHKTTKLSNTKQKKGSSNMEKARIIFQELINTNTELPTRKVVMEAFMNQLNISSQCASTYNHNIRQKYVDKTK